MGGGGRRWARGKGTPDVANATIGSALFAQMNQFITIDDKRACEQFWSGILKES